MGQRFSLRRPTTPQERSGMKKRRLAPFEMTVWWMDRLARLPPPVYV